MSDYIILRRNFLSKPSFKIAAKDKRHTNEPMACDLAAIDARDAGAVLEAMTRQRPTCG
jgi:hypothetical protein